MVGVDLVFIPEFQRQLSASLSIIERSFSPSELGDYRAEHLAGLWAAKEAVIKAGGVKGASPADVVISQDEDGTPWGQLGDLVFAVSISHHGEYAVAIAQKLPQ